MRCQRCGCTLFSCQCSDGPIGEAERKIAAAGTVSGWLSIMDKTGHLPFICLTVPVEVTGKQGTATMGVIKPETMSYAEVAELLEYSAANLRKEDGR